MKDMVLFFFCWRIVWTRGLVVGGKPPAEWAFPSLNCLDCALKGED